MKIGILVLLLIFAKTASSQTLTKKLNDAYSVFENDPQLKYSSSSLTVLHSETGEIIFSKNGNTGMVPASTLKTVTSATAFSLLGPDFRWETTLSYSGTVINGVLRGNIILKGSGDPTLGSDRYAQSKPEVLLARWTSAIKQAGIKKIEGKVIVDDSLFGTQITPQGWIWQDIGNYYGAGASSASWRENEFGIKLRAGGKAGEPARLSSTDLEVPGVTIVNEVTTGKAGSGDNVYAYSSPYSDIIYLRGTYGIDLNKTIMIAIPDPALQLATELSDKLTKSGMSVSEAASTVRLLNLEQKSIPNPNKQLDLYSSPSLSQVVYWLNQKSLNLYAENMLKTLALKQGREASFDEGVNVVRNFWTKKAGIDLNSISILDGSGLSPENRITTTTMARILQSVRRESWFNSFYESLPLYNNSKMKSGSIRNVLCYAGYEKTATGVPVTFVIFSNNYSGSTSSIKQKIFKLLDNLK